MVKDKQHIVNNLKLKEFYDPNALHDLKEINDLDNIIKELKHNRQMYLKTFVDSKILTKDELLSLIPDHKLDQMLIKGLKYFKYLGLFDFYKNPRSLFDLKFNIKERIIYHDIHLTDDEMWNVAHNVMINNECVIFNELKIESFIIVNDAIICLPINKEQYTTHDKDYTFNGKNLKVQSFYQTNFRSHTYHYKSFYINIEFDGLTNEVVHFDITTQNKETFMFLNTPIFYSKKHEER